MLNQLLYYKKLHDGGRQSVMLQETRKFRRFSTEVMKINGKMMFASTVEIIDISLGGIALHIDRALKMGSEYTLRIETKDHSISVKGAVVWSTLSGSRKTAEGDVVPLYSVGIKFSDLASERVNSLMQFIDSYKEEYDSVKLHGLSGLRVNMRFHIAPDGKCLLTCPEDFTVKKISLGGMQIETGNALDLDQQWPMEILLPGDGKIEFTGRVASLLPLDDNETELFAVGIEFLNMSDEDAGILAEFINTLS